MVINLIRLIQEAIILEDLTFTIAIQSPTHVSEIHLSPATLQLIDKLSWFVSHLSSQLLDTFIFSRVPFDCRCLSSSPIHT